MPILPGAEPYAVDGGDVAVLFCHGFTGSPQSLRPWAEHHAAAGLTVRLPRLPGHGTTWRELNLTRWPDWYGCVERELLDLAPQRPVVVAGLSMGGALALRLAQDHPALVSGLVLVNPAVLTEDPRTRVLPVMRHLVPSLPGVAGDIKRPGAHELGYDRTPLHAAWSLTQLFADVRGRLGQVTAPLLLLNSTQDHVVPASSSDCVRSSVASRDVTSIALEDSYHVATLDNDASRIFEESLAHVRRVTAEADTSETVAE